MKIICAWLLLASVVLNAAEKKPAAVRPPSPPALVVSKTPSGGRPLTYRPPKVGLPKVTAACGTRDEGDERFELSVLAPQQEGWTSQESPTLLWHRSGSTRWPLEATLVIPGQAEPILQVRLDHHAAWNRLDLSRYKVRLEPGIVYQWAVTAIVDPGHRSQDLVAGGTIRRVEPTEEEVERRASSSVKESILEFALNGYWYDAVATLAAQLEQTPGDRELRQWSASLCQQGGLAPLVIDQPADGDAIN